jgi:hypothetical protein
MLARRTFLVLLVSCGNCAGASAQQSVSDPLPSWNGGQVKKSITDFVARVTTQGSPDFVAPELRIATFDNDGTLWCEQPLYFQLSTFGDKADMALRHVRLLKQITLPPLRASLLAGVDETDQRCLIARTGTTSVGVVACLDTPPARFASLVGVRGRRAAQKDSIASVTAALISA